MRDEYSTLFPTGVEPIYEPQPIYLDEPIDLAVSDRYSSSEVISGLRSGDILHVTVGIQDMGDGRGPWIPMDEELHAVREAWLSLVPGGVRVIVTHIGEQVEVIR